jgi:hypothetical protein
MIGEAVMVSSHNYQLIYASPHYVYHQIYRCFHVWGRSWIVISLPLALWFADLGNALWEVWLEGTTHTSFTSGLLSTMSSVFWGLIAAINTYTTGKCLIFQHSYYDPIYLIYM